MSFSTSLVYYTKKLTEAFSHWEEQRPQKRSSASWPPEGGLRAAASEPIQHVLCVKDKTLWSFIHFFWIHISIMHFTALYKKDLNNKIFIHKLKDVEISSKSITIVFIFSKLLTSKEFSNLSWWKMWPSLSLPI